MPDATISWEIVCFSGVDFDSHRQRAQAVMSTFAELGASVLFVNNLGLRFPRWSDRSRVARRVRGIVAPTERAARLRVVTPLVIPAQQFAAVRSSACATLTHTIRRRLSDRRPRIVWTYLPLPVVRDVAAGIDADLLVYDWADDASEHLLTRSARHRTRVAAWEDDMAREADLVFLSSAELARRRADGATHAHVVAHGIAASHGTPGDPPPSVAALPHPRVAFVGHLNEWIDVQLLAGVAAARPDWSFVLVGPRRVDVGALARLPNVLLTGEVPHAAVPTLLAACDAAVIPYRVAPATTAASPVKLREYLAQGLPVVSVDIPEVRPFAPAVRIAAGVSGFATALDDAIADGRVSGDLGQRLWRDTATEMIGHVQGVLRARRRPEHP